MRPGQFPLNVEFEDLEFSVKDKHVPGGKRRILKSLSGKFKTGELTAVLGSSGAGKSTLLNVLAGYVTTGVKGNVKVNNRLRDLKTLRKLSSYIQQEDLVQPHLTVQESMVFAAAVKLGSHYEHKEKLSVIDEVTKLLGLEQCRHTRSENLSGGETKRLVIALELINDPPVIFLDEPISGLDNFSAKQCMNFLQKVSRSGRIVICTIHQPPTSIFQMFDQVYILADGFCVYNGLPSELVPFLSLAGCPCPTTHNPADYIIEVTQIYPEKTEELCAVIQNGKDNMRDEKESPNKERLVEDLSLRDNGSTKKDTIVFPASSAAQCEMLIRRTFLQMSRNQLVLYLQFFYHLLCGIVIGAMFYGTGKNGSQTLAVFKLCLVCMVFYLYTYGMQPVLTLPFELKYMKREYFNRWYSLKAYFLASCVTTVPLLVVLCMMSSTIIYVMSDLPLEASRYLGFCLMGQMVSMCSQSIGYCVGSTFNATNGAIVGPASQVPFVVLAMYGMGYRNAIEPFMKVLMSLSYFRYVLLGYCNSIFFERTPLECDDEVYCHYSNPELFLKDMGVPDVHFLSQLGMCIFFLFFIKIVSYLLLKLRLETEFLNRISQER